MLKLTKTGIGLLTKQYQSVLRKCLLLNLGIFALTATNTIIQQNAYALTEGTASGYVAIAIGAGSNAYGDDSVVVGVNSSSGLYSIAMGVNTNATGINSVALGSWSTVTGDSSVVLGAGSSTNESSVVAIGNRRIVSVAEGTAANNAVTVSQLGNIAAGTEILNANGENAITFGTGSGQTTVGTALSTLANQLYNYYYTFRVDERAEVIDSASFFQKDFSTLQEVDLQSKNPTHLGAFAKCDEVCPRPSERFASSLSQEQMLKNDASIDAGTFSICSLQIENVNEKLSNVFDV